MTEPPAAILLDIEGTVAPISFVHEVLFPYARARLGSFLAASADEPDIAAALVELNAMMPGAPPVQTLLALMDRDAKITPLKLIQGRIWAQGYTEGSLISQFYPDVVPMLRAWRHAGIRLAVYSSGSREAQRLLFGHAPEGDLTPLFDGFYDTEVGGKREAASYAGIARAFATPPGHLLFLSDVEAELAAAAAAGLTVCQIVRPQDGTIASTTLPHAADLTVVIPELAPACPQ